MHDFGFYFRKGWPLAILLALLAAALYVNHKVKIDYENKINAAEQKLTSMKSEISLSQLRADEYRKAKAGLGDYLKFMHGKQESQKLIDRLKSDAAEFKLKLSDVQIDVPRLFVDRNNPREAIPVKFQASFRGAYSSLGKFLKEFEKRPYLEKIDEMNITAASPDGRELNMSIKGSLRVFDRSIFEWCKDNES